MLRHRLRHRVTLQKPVASQDTTTGATTISWQTATDNTGTRLTNVPAEVLTGLGREFRESGTTQAETTARLNIRWFPVDRIELYQWRILWDGRTYNISSAETDRTARREWRLKCTDGVNDGE